MSIFFSLRENDGPVTNHVIYFLNFKYNAFENLLLKNLEI